MEQVNIILGVLIGTALGLLSGLLPGIHPNTISQFLSNLEVRDAFLLASIIVLSTAVNNMIALLPAIFLFIPDSDSVLSVLPAQKLLKDGKGRLAVMVCAISCVITLLFLAFILPLSFAFLPYLYSLLKPYLAHFLMLFSIFFIIQDKARIMESFSAFMISGIFGIAVLSTSVSSLLQESLFAVFVGFFALSSIILSIKDRNLIPRQREEEYKVEIGKNFLAIILLSTVIGAISDIFPAINSPAQLATFVSPIANSPLLFLSSTTSITVSHYANSIVAFDRIGKARTGTLVSVSEVMGEISEVQLIWLIAVYFAGTLLGVLILLILSEKAVSAINNLDQRLMNFFLFAFLFVSVFLFSGIFGVFISILAMFIGLIPPLLGVRRTHLMAFLIVPSIIALL